MEKPEVVLSASLRRLLVLEQEKESELLALQEKIRSVQARLFQHQVGVQEGTRLRDVEDGREYVVSGVDLDAYFTGENGAWLFTHPVLKSGELGKNARNFRSLVGLEVVG